MSKRPHVCASFAETYAIDAAESRDFVSRAARTAETAPARSVKLQVLRREGEGNMTEDKVGRPGEDEFVRYMRDWSKRYLGRVRAIVHTIAMIRSEIDGLAEQLDGNKLGAFLKKHKACAAQGIF